MNLLKKIKGHDLVELFMNGNFGLEKEGLRVKLPADLATTNHPDSLGNKEHHPYIKTDYGEAMPELITPPLSPYLKAHSYLQTLTYVLFTNLKEDEYIWPFSVPCKTPRNDEEIKISQTADPELNKYRLYTATKYGRKRQLINGIHINYSFNDEFLKRLFLIQDEFATLEKLRNELYLKFASNFIRYQWLIVYLFGASPIAEDNFFECPFFIGKELPTKPMRSLRNSEYGFINRPEVRVRYNSIENYMGDLQAAVESNLLQKEREYYGDVRLRATFKDSKALLKDEIQYVEIRSFDNNPYHASGIEEASLQFIHLFFLTMISMSGKACPKETEKGVRLTRTIAEEHPYSKTTQYKEGIWLLEEMRRLIEVLELEECYSTLVNKALDLLNYPEKTIAGRVIKNLEAGSNLLSLGKRLGWEHKVKIISNQELPGFEHLPFAKRQEIYEILRKGSDASPWIFEEAN